MHFNFYDPRSLPISSCPPPLLEKTKIVTTTHATIQKCRENILKNFLDADMMYSLACYLQWLLLTSHPENRKPTIPLLPKKTWMQNLMVNVKKGTSGEVHLSESLERRLPVALKFNLKGMEGIHDIVHEYMVAIHGMNEIRRLVPNFCYSFAMYHHEFKVRMIMEKVQGTQLLSFLHRMNLQQTTTQDMQNFWHVWIQIVLSLEIAQETLFFTHYDLHAENVVIRELGESLPYLSFPILDHYYKLPETRFIATILDFGHSTIRFDKGFIGKTRDNAFPEHGMYPFYIAGADLFKLMCYIYLTAYRGKRFAPNSNGAILQKCFAYFLLHFYHIQVDDPTRPNYIAPKTMEETYYNGTRLASIYRSPYEFLRFFESRKHDLLTMTGLQNYPWEVLPMPVSFPFYKTLKYHTDETYWCFQELFCTPITILSKNLYHFTTQNEEVALTIEELNTLLQKKIPLLEHTQLHTMWEFLKPEDLWKKFIKYVHYQLTQFRKAKITASAKFYLELRHYRAYITITGYTNFYEQFYKLRY